MKKLILICLVFCMVPCALLASGINGAGGGTMALQNASAVAITGGTLTGTAYTSGSVSLMTAPLNMRPPQATDDTASAYSVGNYWQYRGQVWLNKRNTASAAMWQAPANSNVLPGDATATAPLGAYGVIKLLKAYAGNAFTITRASDSTTKDIPFLSSGEADWALADAFCRGTTCGVSTWYDQTANGYNITQATAASMPQIYSYTMGGRRVISFDAYTTVADKQLINAAMPVTSIGNCSLVFVGRQGSGYTTTGKAMWTLGSSSAQLWLMVGIGGRGLNLNHASTNIVLDLFALQTAAPVVDMMVSSTTATWSENDTTESSGTTGYSGASTGVILGSDTTSGYSMQADALAFFVYNSALSASDQAALKVAAYANFGIYPQDRELLAFEGDSITAGYSPSATQPVGNTFVNQFAESWGRPLEVFNFGLSGQQVTAMAYTTALKISVLATVPAKTRIMHMFIGTNDLAANISATTTYAAIQTRGQAYQTAGYKVIVGTILPRTGSFSGGQTAGGFETARLALNTMIVTGYQTFANAVVDYGGDTTMGPVAAASDSTLFVSGVHPTFLGYSYLASVLTNAIQSLLAR